MMNGFIKYVAVALLALTVSCSTAPTDGEGASSGADDFSDFDSSASNQSPEESVEQEMSGEQSQAEPIEQAANEEQAQEKDEFAEFSDEKSAEAPTEAPPPESEPAPVADAPPPELEPAPVADAPQPEIEPAPVAEAPAPEEAPQPVAEAPQPQGEPVQAAPVDQSGLVSIVDIQYRANDSGGTVVIEGNGPLQYQQRLVAETNQFIVEIPSTKLPRKLKRPFNTRDFKGTIGSVDAYQGKTSTTSRIVIQLRPGSPEPVVQAEGNNIFVVAQPPGSGGGAQAAGEGDAAAGAGAQAGAPAEAGTEQAASEEIEEPSVEDQPVAPPPSKLLATEGIEEFLASNQSFYGKKISIESDDADVRDIFKLISEEANINLVISDDVKGKLNLKLRQVPWDQALVMVMKAKSLGYTRVGNVLRIAPLKDIKSEEEDSIKMMQAKKANAVYKVRTIQVNYAKVEELEKQVRTVLSAKGTAVADPRTSSLIVSDIDEHMDRAQKLVKALDVPPQQVLIEGKVVEASDNFQRAVGVNWNVSGRQTQISGIKSSTGNLRTTMPFSISPSMTTGTTFGLNFSLGTLDILGDLTASLRLFETQGLVKVISSPRIVTLHNESAEISQTTEIPLITATQNANGTSTPIVSFKPVKLRLQVVPHITNDGSVIMSMDVIREVAGEIANQATQARPVNSRGAKTKVIVRNSQTAVVGGIYQNESVESEDRVPGLGKIPVLGWLFKSNQKEKRRSELLIFLTPRILGQLEGATAPSPGGEEL